MFSSYNLIIEVSIILIISFFFGEISKRTSVPSVLMLIILGVIAGSILKYFEVDNDLITQSLETLGIVGLIMIVLEAALELKLEKEKIIPITKSLIIALLGLLASTWLTALVLQYFIPNMTTLTSWIYATPLSILSSAIIIPSVVDLQKDKKEFHIYESTFSDILGIMLFYFLTGQISSGADAEAHGSGFGGFTINTLLTILIAFLSSYMVIFIFQRIKTSTKLFLLIAVLLLIYSVSKKFHLSALLIILIFGLLISNMDVFFRGRLKKWLDHDAAHEIYHGLHVITMETAFVVRTLFFVIFGMTITFDSLLDLNVLGISAICLAIIYVVRFGLLRVGIGKNIIPQLYIAPRGLITILLFNDIPESVLNPEFKEGILLYVIIGTSIIMTIAMIYNKRRTNGAISKVKNTPIRSVKWRLPE